MEFRIIGPGGDNLEIDNIQDTISKSSMPVHQVISVGSDFGKMIFRHFKGDGFEIWNSNYHIDQAIELTGRGETEVLELHIQLQNNFLNNWDGVGEDLLRQYQYGLTYSPFVCNKVHFSGAKHYETFDVHFTKSYLQKHAMHFPLLDQFMVKISANQPATISDIPRYLTPDMIRIIKQILSCPFNKGAADLYLESKVIELLLLVLDHVSDKHPLAPVKLSAYDIERIHEARDLMLKDFENPPTIIELSRKVALNDFKLKKGFKYLFGTTIFDYLQQQRMEKARILLLETDLPIQDIAFMIGYNYVSNFNAAFAKHFNYTAAYLRRHRN